MGQKAAVRFLVWRYETLDEHRYCSNHASNPGERLERSTSDGLPGGIQLLGARRAGGTRRRQQPAETAQCFRGGVLYRLDASAGAIGISGAGRATGVGHSGGSTGDQADAVIHRVFLREGLMKSFALWMKGLAAADRKSTRLNS